MREKILQALDEIGIQIPVNPNNPDEDIDLRDYIQDSLTFVSAIVQIEEYLGINIPDEYLFYDKIASLNSFCYGLEELVKS